MKITEIKENAKNPRVMKGNKFYSLVKSLVTFPEMMNLRPIVVDNNNVVLGGNMRLKALRYILKNREKVENFIEDIKEDARREFLLNFWANVKKTNEVPTVKADELSEEQKREFIIKDNVAFGDWDWDTLANEWETPSLSGWGLDLWNPDTTISTAYNVNTDKVNTESNGTNDYNIPEELLNYDLTPEPVENIKGEDETEYKRVIIVYKPEDEEGIAGFLGVDCIKKIIYRFEELKK